MTYVIIFKKFFYYTILVGSLPVMAQTVIQDHTNPSTLSKVIVVMFLLVTIMPELLLVFKGYRTEIVNGIKDGDGVMNSIDMKNFVSLYGPFSCLRAMVFFGLYSMVEPWQPPSQLLWTLVAVGTGTAIPQIAKMFGK